MTRLQRALAVANGECVDTTHLFLVWALARLDREGAVEAALIEASLILDGYPARWPHVCWRCAPGWGHNAGGKDSILRHKPVARAAARKGS